MSEADTYPITSRNRVRRRYERGHYGLVRN